LFKNFIMLEHSILTVNNKDLRISYEDFNEMLNEKDLKGILIRYIMYKQKNRKKNELAPKK